MGRYAEVFHRSLADPESFWREAAEDIDWYRAPTAVLDASNPPFYRWFADGVLNTCFNALDRHVRDGRSRFPPPSRTPRSSTRCAPSWQARRDTPESPAIAG
jgi:propionyl-CoA synthetase